MDLALVAFAAGLASQAAASTGPKPAPAVYATHNYALTFSTPAGNTYCPLPETWTGSDHGTVLFLSRPLRCGDSDYQSSSRGFEPEDTPRIEVYYGYRVGDSPDVRTCRAAGKALFMGRLRRLCRSEAGPLKIIELWAPYAADQPAEVSLRLVTAGDRLARDTATLVRFARSVRPCRVSDATPAFGSGTVCPKVGWF